MNCPACGAPLTLAVGAEQSLTPSVTDTLLAADEDEVIEIVWECTDCGWTEKRQIRVEAIDTTPPDEAVRLGALVDKISDELDMKDSLSTLEDSLAEARQQRHRDPATYDMRGDS